MTKEEAQKIIDYIIPETVIDSNWLDSLLLEPDLIKLRALQLVSNICSYNDLLEIDEGEFISKYQTKKEIYVGRTIKYINNYYLLVGQDKMYVWYFNNDGDICFFKINEIKNYLI